MDTRPDERDDITQPRLGLSGTLRFVWRQLTSMRTALLLLLLLAIAAVPGSIWPQRGIDAARVATYLDQHRTAGPWLDRLGFFDVYASPWFAAIYLLLFVSLVGCVLPRTPAALARHARPAAPRAAAARAPARARRARGWRRRSRTGALAARGRCCGGRRFRVRKGRGDDPRAVSGESGYLRETGNLRLPHRAARASSSASRSGTCSAGAETSSCRRGDDVLQHDLRRTTRSTPGRWVDPEKLTPFSVTIDTIDVQLRGAARGAQFGAPRDFTAHTTTTERPGRTASAARLR